jgi:hypothetical protein
MMPTPISVVKAKLGQLKLNSSDSTDSEDSESEDELTLQFIKDDLKIATAELVNLLRPENVESETVDKAKSHISNLRSSYRTVRKRLQTHERAKAEKTGLVTAMTSRQPVEPATTAQGANGPGVGVGKIQLAAPPKFTGDLSTYLRWKQTTVRYVQTTANNAVSDQVMVNIMGSFLEGDAAEWFNYWCDKRETAEPTRHRTRLKSNEGLMNGHIG